MTRYAEAMQLEGRGVYWARYRKNGLPVLYCVDSLGDVKRRLVLQPRTHPEDAIEYLWRHLDSIDPRPQLRLVRDGADLPSTARIEKGWFDYDPYTESVTLARGPL